MAADSPVDFFVSYTGPDREWAAWIAWQLEEAGHTVLLQVWDFPVGTHFVSQMDRATRRARQTVVVLSEAYLKSGYAAAEWEEAWRRDPDGKRRGLLVFAIDDCRTDGLLGQVVRADLAGLDRVTAREVVLAAVSGTRPKPSTEPDFPAPAFATQAVPAHAQPVFPAAPDRILNAGDDEPAAQYICYVSRARLDGLYHQVDMETLANPTGGSAIGRLSFGNPVAATEDPRRARTTVARLTTVREHLERTAQIGDLAAVLASHGQLHHAWYLVSTRFRVARWRPESPSVHLDGKVGGYRLRLSCAKESFAGLGREPDGVIPTSTNRFLFEERVALPMQGLVRLAAADPGRRRLLGSPLYLVLNPLRVDLGEYNDVVL
jgi:hypothetical protein